MRRFSILDSWMGSWMLCCHRHPMGLHFLKQSSLALLKMSRKSFMFTVSQLARDFYFVLLVQLLCDNFMWPAEWDMASRLWGGLPKYQLNFCNSGPTIGGFLEFGRLCLLYCFFVISAYCGVYSLWLGRVVFHNNYFLYGRTSLTRTLLQGRDTRPKPSC